MVDFTTEGARQLGREIVDGFFENNKSGATEADKNLAAIESTAKILGHCAKMAEAGHSPDAVDKWGKAVFDAMETRLAEHDAGPQPLTGFFC